MGNTAAARPFNKKVVVTGSLGHISLPLTKILVAKGLDVTVVTSKEEKRAGIESLGAKAAVGSVDDVKFLTSTFEGVNTVYAMVPPDVTRPSQDDYHRLIAGNYTQAVQATDVKHIVFLSSYGAYFDHGTGIILSAHYAEQVINEALGGKVAITILRPGYFYHNLIKFIGMIKNAGIIGANFGGNDFVPLVAPSDIAAAAAKDILLTPIAGSKIRYIVSDERTVDEIAQVLGAAIGKPDLKWILFTDEQNHAGMIQNGLPTQMADKLVEAGSALHQGILTVDYLRHKASVVLGQVKLEDFAKEFAIAYNK